MSLDLLSLYKSAFKFRYIETLISKEYYRGFIRCPTHLSVGQEILPSLLSFLITVTSLSAHIVLTTITFLKVVLYQPLDELHGLPSAVLVETVAQCI